MNHSSFDISESQVIDNYSSWFNSKNGITGTGEESASLFHMPHLYPVPDLPQETAYQVQHGKLSEYDSCFRGYWGDDLFSCKYTTDDDDDGCNDTRARTKHEDSNQSEDQYRSYTSYCEGEFGQPDCDYYNPWSYNLFCEDEDSDSQYNGDETSSTYGHHMDDVGLFKGIFGSFPCLRQYAGINQ
ncbi:hypothetical protein Gohar_025265 [Gossypium harknessii]|uniref:Uncharacterized protein n=1 Tax=Gossypium harknessii TaxID=34285 RepID=A0A7J9HIF5_9ROSI|nr:hypothetical protein [Gossypium harknessii]